MKHARDDYDHIQEITTNGTTRRIPEDEPVFLLRGQDRFAAETVRHWARLVELSGGLGTAEIASLARKQADLMDKWPVHKTPDRKI